MAGEKTLRIRYVGDATGVTRAQAQIAASTQSLGTRMQSLSMAATGRTLTTAFTVPIVAGLGAIAVHAARTEEASARG